MQINIDKIERERLRLGLDRIQLARAMGMHYQGLDYIYKTKQTKLPTIQRMADFFGLDPKDLLTN